MKLLISLLSFGAVASCAESRAELDAKTSSIRVDLVAPANRGSFATRLDDSLRDVTVNLTALDADGNVDTTFNSELQVYVQYLGTLTPSLTDTPLTTVKLTAGVAMGKKITLKSAFGPTTIWFDDGKNQNPTLATGASEPLWFRDPYISDIQQPADETLDKAMYASPLEAKQIDIHTSRYGARGVLVVNSVFAQGYTVSDMQCATGLPNPAPPCTTQPYDSVMVFSFSAPRFDEEPGKPPGILAQGQVITRFNGGISEFNGLTEIGFPRNFSYLPVVVNKAFEPAPVKLGAGRAGDPDRDGDSSPDNWFAPLPDAQGIINFERYEAAPIEMTNVFVCSLDPDGDGVLDPDYTTYKQWKIDLQGGAGCPKTATGRGTNLINIVTAGIADFDPLTLQGKTLSSIVGIVRPVSGLSATSQRPFNIWIVYPRSIADLTLP